MAYLLALVNLLQTIIADVSFNDSIFNIATFSLALVSVMVLYDRTFSPFVRRLAGRVVVVEKSKLNLLV